MAHRTRYSKKPTRSETTPMAMGPMIGLMAVCLAGMVGMYLWTSRRATARLLRLRLLPFPRRLRILRSTSTRRLQSCDRHCRGLARQSLSESE